MAIGKSILISKDVITKWCTVDHNDKINFDSALSSFRAGLAGAIADATENQPGPMSFESSNMQELTNVKMFFKDDGENMDDCIRWTLLYGAVESGEDDRNIQLIDMILRRNPLIAFAETTTKSLVDRCLLSKPRKDGKNKESKTTENKKKRSSHFEANLQTPSKESLFHIAIFMGRCKAVGTILECTKQYLEEKNEGETFLKLVREDGKNSTAKMAIEEGSMAMEALKTVLKFLPDFIIDDNSVLLCAIEHSRITFIEDFIERQKRTNMPILSETITKAIETAGKAKNDNKKKKDDKKEENAMDVARIILASFGPKEKYSPEVIGLIIKYDLKDLWDEKDREEVQKLGCELHMAVLHGRVDLVKKLLKENPDLALKEAEVTLSTRPSGKGNTNNNENGKSTNGEKANGKYALWCNNNPLNNKPEAWSVARRTIRSILIYYIVKYAPNMRSLSEILEKSEEPERELSFDMSRLNFKYGKVSEFFRNFSYHDRSRKLLQYEETIRYAEFPVLDMRGDENEWPRSHMYLQAAHTEVFDTLDWLAQRGVRRIISLKVPDRMMNPHDEERIADAVRRFHVEELDWRFLDLSLNIFQPHGCEEDRIIDLPPLPDKTKSKAVATTNDAKPKSKTFLTQLHLYSSGKKSALNHWFGQEGIRTMHLDYLSIHVINELMTKQAAQCIAATIRTEVGNIKKEQEQLESDVDPGFWNPTHQLVHLNEIAQCLSPRLAQFTEFYRKLARKMFAEVTNRPDKYPATRVAIIDNGILTVTPAESSGRSNNNATPSDGADLHKNDNSNVRTADFFEKGSLWSRIREGKSFVSKDRASPWFLASNPHGTQMANLVCAIDPLCELYIAKIADGKYGYSAERAAEAVRWAMAKNVDIISMSFTMGTTNEDFKTALTDASKKGIILMCSLHDEGDRVDMVYPADVAVERKLRMAGCDEFGKLKMGMGESRYDYCVNSQNVAAGGIPFLTENEPISGSSVATALGAGLCSLILSCEWVAKAAKATKAAKAAEAARERTPIPGTSKSTSHPDIADMIGKERDVSRKDTTHCFNQVKPHLNQMVSNATKFLVLERFAKLDQIKEINNSTLESALFLVGGNGDGYKEG